LKDPRFSWLKRSPQTKHAAIAPKATPSRHARISEKAQTKAIGSALVTTEPEKSGEPLTQG
jgi:hypothetical protein